MRARLWSAIGAIEGWFLQPRHGPGIWSARLIVALLTILACANHAALRDHVVERDLDPSELAALSSPPGLGVKVELAGSSGDSIGLPAAKAIWLSEDGQELGPPHSPHALIDSEGKGRYSHWKEDLYFSSSDGTSPLTNGRTYRVRYTRGITSLWVVSLLAAWFLVWTLPLRLLLLRLERSPPVAIFLALFALTVGLRIIWGLETGYVDYVRVGEMPFSDAQGWMELSEDFARGGRENASWGPWSARRPLTYVINGSWMALFGISTFAIVVFNVLCSGLSTVLIFDALRRLTPLPIALATALLHAFSILDAAYGTTTLSEPSGYFLSNVALWLLARAILGERRGESPTWLYFWAGVTIAVANLSRPLTLLSAPAIPFVVLLLLSRRGLTKRQVLLGAARAAVFAGIGVAICLAPWIIRQKLEHDLLTLSDNTAEMLYSASDPKYGSWSPAASMEATNAGHTSWAARNRYFNARFKENLRNHPGHYAKVITKSAASSVVGQMASPTFWLVGLGLLALWSSGPKRVRGEFFVYGGAALAVALAIAGGLAPPRVWVFFALGVIFALVTADVLALLVFSLGATLLGIGLVGSPYIRFNYSLHWLALALELWAVWQLGRWARRGGTPGPDLESLRAARALPEVPGERSASRLITRILLLLLATLGLGCGIALTRLVSPPARPALRALESPGSWRGSALAAPPASDYAPVSSGLAVRRFLIRSNYLATFRAGERVHHDSGLFREQGYARSYFLTSPPVTAPPGAPVQFGHASFAAELDFKGEVPVTAVGVWVAYGPELWPGTRSSLFEVVAYTRDPKPEGARWVWASPADRRAHAAALAERVAAGEVYTDPPE